MNIRKITKRFRKEINEKEVLLTCLTNRDSSGTAIQVLVEQDVNIKIYIYIKSPTIVTKP